jgi:hypothetical protein
LDITIPAPRSAVDEYFTDTNPSDVEPTPDIIAARKERENRVRRHGRSRQRAARKAVNGTLRELSQQRSIKDEHVAKPGLTDNQIEMLTVGTVLTNTQGLHLTRSQRRQQQANKRRAAKRQQMLMAELV